MLCFWDYPLLFVACGPSYPNCEKIVTVKIRVSTALLVNAKNVLRQHIMRRRVQDCSARPVAVSKFLDTAMTCLVSISTKVPR